MVLTSPAICLKMFRNCSCSSLSWSVLPCRGCGSIKENWFPVIREMGRPMKGRRSQGAYLALGGCRSRVQHKGFSP